MPATARNIGSLDDYLDRICEQIQLSESQFNMAERRYRRVGEWLTETETPLEALAPDIFPQGSMLQRTTIRPMRLGQDIVPFDIDTVCRCDFDPYAKTSQSLYGSILSRLMAHEEFKRRIQEAQKTLGTSGKCVRLAYTDDDFFLDVVPACADPSDAEGIRLLMCDPGRWSGHSAPIQTWKRTDPFRFAAWVQARAQLVYTITERRVTASIAPVPPREEADVKAPLRRIIQLLKRRRDIEFLGDNCRPTSILLSTLAGRHYSGQASISEGLAIVLSGISQQIRTAGSGRITVPNPADELAPHDGGVEDLARPMDEATYTKFTSMIGAMVREIDSASQARGVPRLYPVLAESFGDGVVKKAFNAVESDVRGASSAGRVGAAVGTSQIHILTEPKVSAGVQPVRANDFHLDH